LSPRQPPPLIDRLLDSPHYGEHMAQHWLEVTRYADSSGFSNDYERGNAWRYRDYVVRAFNGDKLYDQFIKEQIAGDEIDANDPEKIIDTGFLRTGPWDLTGMAAVLAMGSDGERSSPVERGAWVLRKLLHKPPPPAPANVPQLSRHDGKLLPARELLQTHMEEAQCSQCHRRIDPIGFGLDSSLRELSETSAFAFECIRDKGCAQSGTQRDVDRLEPIGPHRLGFMKNDTATFQDLLLHGRHTHGAEFGLCIHCCFRRDAAGFA
jgi:hypothetical protein